MNPRDPLTEMLLTISSRIMHPTGRAADKNA